MIYLFIINCVITKFIDLYGAKLFNIIKYIYIYIYILMFTVNMLIISNALFRYKVYDKYHSSNGSADSNSSLDP